MRDTLHLLPMAYPYDREKKNRYCYFKTSILKKLFQQPMDLRASAILGRSKMLVDKVQPGHFRAEYPACWLPSVKDIRQFNEDSEFAGVVCRQINGRISPIQYAYVYSIMTQFPELEHMLFVLVTGSREAAFYAFERHSFMSWFEHTYS